MATMSKYLPAVIVMVTKSAAQNQLLLTLPLSIVVIDRLERVGGERNIWIVHIFEYMRYHIIYIN